jgi:hypothetical protein
MKKLVNERSVPACVMMHFFAVKKPDGNEKEAQGGSKREPVNDHAERKEGRTSGGQSDRKRLRWQREEQPARSEEDVFRALSPRANV